ncbi:MAG: GNAT family N-acetyltransferase [Chloroflexota bacterium]
MPDVAIRQLHGDDIFESMRLIHAYAFRPTPPLPDADDTRRMLADRDGMTFYGLFEDGCPMACAASTALTQNVRGADYATGGYCHVTTHPSARRRGYARQVLAALSAALREQGTVFSCLYPTTEIFYQRLGWVAFPVPRRSAFAPEKLLPLLERDLPGDVELLPLAEGYDAYRSYCAAHRARVHGYATFDHPDPRIVARDDRWLAFARVAGETVGVMMYDLRGEALAEYALRVGRFYYHSPVGRYLLLQWIARHVDQANRVELTLPPTEQPETWMPDLRGTMAPIHRAPNARVLNVGGLGGMRVGVGRAVVALSDALCPCNEGVWTLESVAGALRVARGGDERTAAPLGMQALAALVYLGTDPAEFAPRGWGAPNTAQQAALRGVFPPAVPYLHEGF